MELQELQELQEFYSKKFYSSMFEPFIYDTCYDSKSISTHYISTSYRIKVTQTLDRQTDSDVTRQD